MSFFKRNPDPLSDKARALNDRIARLQEEIAALNAKIESDKEQPRLRAPTTPAGSATPTTPDLREPIFEEVDHQRVTRPAEPEATANHYNDLGVRKFDLVSVWRRVIGHFRGPTTSNPKLVNYLVAGSIHGLRPLRYEKRIARNRFLAFFVLLVLIFTGILLKWLRTQH
jgi:hypothetical protein